MTIAGGVIAIVVGAIQTILAAAAAWFTGAASQIVEAAGDGTEAGADLAAAAQGAVFWSYVGLIIGLATFVLGIVVIVQKKRGPATILLGVGILAIVITLINFVAVFQLLWPGLILLAGILAFLGTKDATACSERPLATPSGAARTVLAAPLSCCLKA